MRPGTRRTAVARAGARGRGMRAPTPRARRGCPRWGGARPGKTAPIPRRGWDSLPAAGSRVFVEPSVAWKMLSSEGVSLPGAACHKGFDDAGTDALQAVFAETVRTFEACDVPYVVVGGLASAALGRPRASGDVDILVAPHDARRALSALAERGFATDELNPLWLFKATKQRVLVDLLFKMKGDIYLDGDMLARAPVREVHGHPARVMPPEDLVVVK